MKKNYLFPMLFFKSKAAFAMRWPANCHLTLLYFGLLVLGLSHPLQAQCPTVSGHLTTINDLVCKNTKPQDITLSDFHGNILKWQSASDADFTSDVTDLLSTDYILTGDAIGPLAATTFFRAVVAAEGCAVAYTNPIALTVPLPVVYADGAWSSPPNSATPVIVTADLNLSANFNVCSCEVTNGATLMVGPAYSLNVKTNINVVAGSNIVLENNASILQSNDIAVNTGNVTFKSSTSTMKLYDFHYWSTPVTNMTLKQLSPNTLYDKYFSYDPTIDNWVMHPHGTVVMEPGVGYIVRAPQNWSQTNATQGVYTATFTGKPVTGTVPATLKKDVSSYNLIGNPYPSAIDLELFLNDADNESLTNGTIYLWTHNTAISNLIPGNAVYNYARDDYAKFNMTGGITTASTSLSGGARPTSTLTSGQSFFVEMNPELPNGTYTAYFKNSMRVDNNHSELSKAAIKEVAGLPVEKHRFWMKISNAGGAYDEMLVGYLSGATNAIDRKYDGAIFPAGNVVSLYSILDDKSLAIQGRALPFQTNDVIPVGFSTTIAGTFTIGLEHFDGLFDSQTVYLLDKNDNSYHDLKTENYQFSTTAGTFNNRFEIRFTSEALGIDTVTAANHISVIHTEGELFIAASDAIVSVVVYDWTGKMIMTKNGINANNFSTTTINDATKVLLVKVQLENNVSVVKKILAN